MSRLKRIEPYGRASKDLTKWIDDLIEVTNAQTEAIKLISKIFSQMEWVPALIINDDIKELKDLVEGEE